MSYFDKLHCIRWNIGFIEKNICDIYSSGDAFFDVKWVKHDYDYRFFADPFILSVNENVIKVLVEEFFYEKKKGVISLLNIDVKNYELIDKKILLDQPFHQSYPFILRHNGKTYVLPEASESGNLFIYDFDEQNETLCNQRVLIPEPLLDSTICQINDRWFLFCTKKGPGKNSDLYVYESDDPLGGFKPVNDGKPLVNDLETARPAGYFVNVGDDLFRVSQVCSKFYGEYVKLLKLNSILPFDQTFIKNIKVQNSEFCRSIHTVNGFGGITVVDGTKRTFRPVFQIINAIKYYLLYKR